MVPVTGFTGLAVTDRSGKTRAIDPQKEKKLKVQYDDILHRWERKTEEWDNTAKQLPWGTQSELIAGAEIMARKTKPFFAELYEINERMVKSKDESKLRPWPAARVQP